MVGRTPVAVLVLVLGGLVFVPAASAQQWTGTADQAAASVDFPVYEFTRRLGLPAVYGSEKLNDHPDCAYGTERVSGELRRRRPRVGRRWIVLVQSGDGCATAAVGERWRRVRVLGRRVTVRRYCVIESCRITPNGVMTMRFSLRTGGERTWIYVSATELTLRKLLRAVRSLRVVDTTRPVVALTGFRSPDGDIWCGLPVSGAADDDHAFCAVRPQVAPRSALLYRDGRAQLCDPEVCVQNFDPEAPLLHDGQTSRLNGFQCVAAGGAVTCTLTSGEHAGKGFRIDAASVSEVSPGAPG